MTGCGVGPRSPFIPEIDILVSKFSLDVLSALLLSPSGTLLNLGSVNLLYYSYFSPVLEPIPAMLNDLALQQWN